MHNVYYQVVNLCAELLSTHIPACSVLSETDKLLGPTPAEFLAATEKLYVV